MSTQTRPHSRWEPADLVQHQIVSAVAARQQNVPRVMFKGGTLLRVCYRHNWRFSEDLDFDWIHPDNTKPAIQDFFDRALNTASRTHRTEFDTKWGTNKLNIYWELPNAVTGVIYTDVKARHHPAGAEPTATNWTILDRYPQIDTTNILGYSPTSMLAAKLDCIANPYRLAPRDYYDLHRLLQDPAIDTNAALDEFTARHQAQHPATTGPGPGLVRHLVRQRIPTPSRTRRQMGRDHPNRHDLRPTTPPLRHHARHGQRRRTTCPQRLRRPHGHKHPLAPRPQRRRPAWAVPALTGLRPRNLNGPQAVPSLYDASLAGADRASTSGAPAGPPASP